MPRRLEFFLPFLPPSENAIRVHRWKGGECYSKEANIFSARMRDFVGKQKLFELQTFMKGHTPNSIYRLTIVLCFPVEQVVNKGWPKDTPTRFKRMDTNNRRKLLEDTLVEVLGGKVAHMDDSLFFEALVVKVVSTETGVQVALEEADISDYGIKTG